MINSVKNVTSYSKFLLLFRKFLSYLVCVPSFKSVNSSSLTSKKYDRDSFTPTPPVSKLIELTEPSDTLIKAMS